MFIPVDTLKKDNINIGNTSKKSINQNKSISIREKLAFLATLFLFEPVVYLFPTLIKEFNIVEWDANIARGWILPHSQKLGCAIPPPLSSQSINYHSYES
jgi:hypothetical protein